jgi:hypothetical protein
MEVQKMRSFSIAVAALATVAISGSSAFAADGALSLRKPVLPASYQESSKTTVTTTMSEMTESSYMGVSSFFNVREANANVVEGEWEVEAAMEWQTGDGVEGDDDFYLIPSIKYGLSDRAYIELEVLPLRLFDGGGHANGEIETTFFYQCMVETDSAPAFGSWISVRWPTGHGSSKVDVSLHGAFTKTLADNWRGHLNGFLASNNGGRGDVPENREHFGWGLGAGVDYAFSEETLGVLNYENRRAEYGGSNDQYIEAGLVHHLTDASEIKLALDYNIDNSSGAEWVTKIQYAFEWK